MLASGYHPKSHRATSFPFQLKPFSDTVKLARLQLNIIPFRTNLSKTEVLSAIFKEMFVDFELFKELRYKYSSSYMYYKTFSSKDILQDFSFVVFEVDGLFFGGFFLYIACLFKMNSIIWIALREKA